MTKKIAYSSSAAEEVAGNEDLITEIFLRLPARSLIRFNSVSKQWSSLISDPQFSRNHTTRRNPSSFIPSGLYFYNSLTKSEEIESVSLDDRAKVRVSVPSLSFLDAAAAGAKIKVIQSCNGLLLCRFTPESSISEVKIYCVGNPTTKKYKILPQPCLAPRESIIEFSFGYDPRESPYYRVLCIKKSMRFYGNCEIVIYSSENGVWRTTDCHFYEWSTPSYDSGVYWNGVIHWTIDDFVRYYSVNFDFNAGDMISMQMPPSPPSFHPKPLRYFGEFCGRFYIIYVRSCSAKRFHVLEKDRDTLKWSVKYRVHMSRLLCDFPEIARTIVHKHDRGDYVEIRYAFCIPCVFKGEKEEDSALVLTIPGKVISYNFKCKTSKVLCELPCQVVDTFSFHSVNAYNYIETLSPL